MNITPKNIYKGRNSDGSTFRVEEWDFATLANLELGGLFIAIIFCMALVSIISPIFAILSIITFSGRFNLMYVLGILFGTYFLYDCSNGWLGVLCLTFFATEPTINIIFRLNIVSIVLCSIFLVFGRTIANMIISPITQYSEDAYFFLSEGEKLELDEQVNRNKVITYFFIVTVSVVTYFLSASAVPKQKGWVERNIDYVSPEKKAKERQDSIERALGDFKSQAERDAYFNEMERRYGN